MFSGIIEEKARLSNVARTSGGCKLTVVAEVASKDARIGDSISVNGVCLTVVEVKGKNVSFDVMEETLRRTNLSEVSAGKIVNMERPLKIGDKVSGHFVTGHVDCTAKIHSITKRANDYAMDIEFPIDKMAYVAEKGSVAIDGVSLTVVEIRGNHLRVYLIPLTLKATNLGVKKVGDLVNIEFDILSKYSQQTQISKKNKNKINVDFLRKHDFL